MGAGESFASRGCRVTCRLYWREVPTRYRPSPWRAMQLVEPTQLLAAGWYATRSVGDRLMEGEVVFEFNGPFAGEAEALQWIAQDDAEEPT